MGDGGLSVSKPLPIGEKATNAVSSCFVFCKRPSSGNLVDKEYSDWIAPTWCILLAFSSETGEISEKPNWVIFPSFLKVY